MKSLQETDEKVGAYISCAFSVAALLLLAVIGLRFFNPWITAYALLFMSVSPMDLSIARRAWQDSMLGCLGLSLVYLSAEITRNTNKLICYIFLVLIGSYCMLIKDTGIIIYGLCIAWLLWLLFIKKQALWNGIGLVAFAALGAGLGFLSLLHAAGGIAPLLEAPRHAFAAMRTNQYALEYQSGPRHYWLQGFWLLSPLSSLLCLLGVGASLLAAEPAGNKNGRVIRWIVFFAAAFMAITLASPKSLNLLNMRYVSVLYAPFYLIAGLGFWRVILFFRSGLKGPHLYAALVFFSMITGLSAFNDYALFQKAFVNTGILDLSIRMVRDYAR